MSGGLVAKVIWLLLEASAALLQAVIRELAIRKREQSAQGSSAPPIDL